MTETEGYTDEFWLRAIELTMSRPRTCEQCFVANGEEITRALCPKNKTYAVVRVALRKPGIIDRSNLGLFCTKCRRGKYEVKTKRADLEKLILPLFKEHP
jgi:hypothetical protein